MSDRIPFAPVDPMKAWQELQKNWTAALKEMTERASSMTPTMSAESLKSFTNAWVDTQKKFIEQGMNISGLFPTGDLADRFQNASKVYLESYKWWAEALGAAQEGG